MLRTLIHLGRTNYSINLTGVRQNVQWFPPALANLEIGLDNVRVQPIFQGLNYSSRMIFLE